MVDITSSGETLKANKLKIIDTILTSAAVVIARKGISNSQNESLKALLIALKAVLDAREKKYLMAHVPKAALGDIKSFLPGLSSPTVMTLMNDDEHVVIHVVVDTDKVYDSIQHLKALGGQGILIMTVDQMVQ